MIVIINSTDGNICHMNKDIYQLNGNLYFSLFRKKAREAVFN